MCAAQVRGEDLAGGARMRREDLVGGCVGGDDGEVEACVDEATQDVSLGAKVIGDAALALSIERAHQVRVRLVVGLIPGVRRLASDGAGEVSSVR